MDVGRVRNSYDRVSGLHNFRKLFSRWGYVTRKKYSILSGLHDFRKFFFRWGYVTREKYSILSKVRANL